MTCVIDKQSCSIMIKYLILLTVMVAVVTAEADPGTEVEVERRGVTPLRKTVCPDGHKCGPHGESYA